MRKYYCYKVLGCPVVGLVASRETGVDDLKQAISRQLENPTVPDNPLVFPKDIADEIHTLTQELCKTTLKRPLGSPNRSLKVIKNWDSAP